jgi:hypothetical protein
VGVSETPENVTCGGCDEAESFGRTEDGDAHGSNHNPRCYGELGAVVCNRDQYAADDFIVGVVDNADDNPADLVGYYRL